MLTNAHLAALILALAGSALPLLAPSTARANCERSPLGTTCGWEEQIAVKEWLVRQLEARARPSIAYHSGDNIGVDYDEGGILDETNSRVAVALIELYCKGKYRVTQRGSGHIDAVCVR
jgi:hypothetical protein